MISCEDKDLAVAASKWIPIKRLTAWPEANQERSHPKYLVLKVALQSEAGLSDGVRGKDLFASSWRGGLLGHMTPSERAADRLIFHTATVRWHKYMYWAPEKLTRAVCGSYMGAVFLFDTVYAFRVLVLRVPAFATWHLCSAGSAGRLASRSRARSLLEVFVCDGRP